jgi:hypothetical protein
MSEMLDNVSNSFCCGLTLFILNTAHVIYGALFQIYCVHNHFNSQNYPEWYYDYSIFTDGKLWHKEAEWLT